MATIRYTEGRGWHDAKIGPRGPFQCDPATLVFHYAQEIFEGMKAYRLPDGGAALFRPAANARRFRNSADRLAMPQLPEGCSSNPCASWSGWTATGFPRRRVPPCICGRS